MPRDFFDPTPEEQNFRAADGMLMIVFNWEMCRALFLDTPA
jgi:hypothetical protein